jgi:uncharacterized membrane protein YjfL (UPF0719 family)
MSGDEYFALVASLVFAVSGWDNWVRGLLFSRALSPCLEIRAIGWLLPILAGWLVFSVLLRWSSHDVRDSSTYLVFYTVMWFGWTGVWNHIMTWLGLDFSDALAYNNRAIAIAVAGGLLAVTFVFAGSNIGEGPSWTVVVFCAAIGTAALLLFWLMDNQLTHVHDAIAIDRDEAAAWRLAGFFVAAGLILGRAVAGDWHSVHETVQDFFYASWPALIPFAVLLVLNVQFRPNPARPVPDPIRFGVLPAAALVVIGIGDIIIQGSWN